MWFEDEIAYILKHLDRPETLQEEDFREWLNKEGHRNLFEEVRDYREAFLREANGISIDPEKEWEHFEAKTVKRRKWYVREALAVVACVSVFLMIGILWQSSDSGVGKIVYETELVGKKKAELILSSGQRIDLERETVDFQERNGILIINTADSYLAYRQDSVVQESDSTKILIYNTLKVPAGADFKLALADGTTILLNCGSELRYPVKFGAGERRVYLDGEAFFNVKKADEWPFVVETEQMHIQVTGTRFNVKSYCTEEIVHTTLVAGAVIISRLEREQAVRLLPSQQFCLDKRTGQVEIKEVDTHLYTDWTEGMFVFRKQRLEEVMNTLSRWYDIEVFYAGADLKDLCLSANLGRYDHIDTILDMIRAMDKVVVDRKGKVITFSWK